MKSENIATTNEGITVNKEKTEIYLLIILDGNNIEELNALLDELEYSTTAEQAARLNRAIEILVMQEAVYLPYAVDRMVIYRPGDLTDIYVQIALGNQYDVVNVGKQEKILK